MRMTWATLLLFASLSGSASANESMQNLDVVQLGTYQAHTDHFVWLSDTPAECKATGNPVLHFQDDQPGGKALLAILMTALVNKRKIDVQTNGCDLVEVYLK
ncbi:hypothetical protein J7373_08805 [Xanthomonas sp. A2111]|uniref:Uncharacterized protein n=1 Tax=Xanthomonas hawaiiensis TaxID=3003247 RepID=A0ABU2I4J6_9XANT|nr:hypothetical protein [Xanthomonas sp. A2111]MBO9828342.1 hypothetical protein [Xanthomonas sp. A2111]MDS9993090.1 hypothetical protein [Xanthomonas sp. A2111]